MALLQKKLAETVASICEKSVDSSPETYSFFFFGHEISLDEETTEE